MKKTLLLLFILFSGIIIILPNFVQASFGTPCSDDSQCLPACELCSNYGFCEYSAIDPVRCDGGCDYCINEGTFGYCEQFTDALQHGCNTGEICSVDGECTLDPYYCAGTCTVGPLDPCPSGYFETGTLCDQYTGSKCCEEGCVINDNCGPCEECLNGECSSLNCTIHNPENTCNNNHECVDKCTFNGGTCQLHPCLVGQTTFSEYTSCDENGEDCCIGGSTNPCASMNGNCQTQCYSASQGQLTGVTECSAPDPICCIGETEPCLNDYNGECTAITDCPLSATQIRMSGTECDILTPAETCCVTLTAADPCLPLTGIPCQETCEIFQEEHLVPYTVNCDDIGPNYVCCEIINTDLVCPGCPGRVVIGNAGLACASLAGHYMYNPDYTCQSGYICCQDRDAESASSPVAASPTYKCKSPCQTEDELENKEYWRGTNGEKCSVDSAHFDPDTKKCKIGHGQCCEQISELEYKKMSGNYNMKDILNKAIDISSQLLAIVGSIALLFFIIAGVSMIFSGGSQEKVSSARTMMVQTVIGLVIFLSAYLIISFVQNTLLGEGESPYKLNTSIDDFK